MKVAHHIAFGVSGMGGELGSVTEASGLLSRT